MTKEQEAQLNRELEIAGIESLKPIIQSVTKEEKLEMSVKQNRDRYDEFPDRLPTKARMPFPPDEHKHIGLYESKQNLYLMIAHVYNRLMGRTDFMLSEIEELKNQNAILQGRLEKLENKE